MSAEHAVHETTTWVVLGRITGSFGIKGWMKVRPYGDDPLNWRQMPEWWLCRDADAPPQEWVAYHLSDCQVNGQQLLISLDTITDRNQSDALKGYYIAAPKDALPATAEDEYYWADLLGCTVFNQKDETLGVVQTLISTGSHDVLQLKDANGEQRLIPFVGAYIHEVALKDKKIIVDWETDW